MSERNIQAVVLAAGKSQRFNTPKTKLLEKICGQEMILYITNLLARMQIPTTVIIGHQGDLIKKTILDHHTLPIQFVTQETQLGTGHAVMCSRPTWQQKSILIINADMPLVTQDILEEIITKHERENSAITFAIAHNPDPSNGAYGRIVKEGNNITIIEAKDFQGDVQDHCCINAGIYLVNRSFLEESIDKLDRNNKNKEFYITDLVKIASNDSLHVSTVNVPFDYVRGINTLQELWAAEQVKRAELIKFWMQKGVRFSLPQMIHIDLHVQIGAGTIIESGNHILGNSVIGKNCVIQGFSSINNSVIEDNATIYSHSIINDATIKKGALIGPFAHIHQKTTIGENTTVGNFVEVKESTIGNHTTTKRLSFVGNAIIGNNALIGTGTVTCNYDGFAKYTTIIHDHARIGSLSALVAPITIGAGADIAAGSVITHDVPENMRAVARPHQVNSKGNTLSENEKTDSTKTTQTPSIKVQKEQQAS